MRFTGLISVSAPSCFDALKSPQAKAGVRQVVNTTDREKKITDFEAVLGMP